MNKRRRIKSNKERYGVYVGEEKEEEREREVEQSEKEGEQEKDVVIFREGHCIRVDFYAPSECGAAAGHERGIPARGKAWSEARRPLLISKGVKRSTRTGWRVR